MIFYSQSPSHPLSPAACTPILGPLNKNMSWTTLRLPPIVWWRWRQVERLRRGNEGCAAVSPALFVCVLKNLLEEASFHNVETQGTDKS